MLEKKQEGKKSLAVLIEPDKASLPTLTEVINLAVQSKVDYLFVGGSLVVSDQLHSCIKQIKSLCSLPILLFPGSPSQISNDADALLYLSLISGRNADLLIGQHVVSAALVKKSGLEIIPTGYMVIDGGAATTVSYISNAAPIPADKTEISICTAMAGEMLGMKLIYMDAGSGAKKAITIDMIEGVAAHITIPLIVGGGIRDAEKAYNNCKAGADIVVVGNSIEKNIPLVAEMAAAVHEVKTQIVM
ncbi:MAG: geranylgeranylglyceryl/heptaprenylglyceryl phosphate synthase [Flavisolibacter sp.]